MGDYFYEPDSNIHLQLANKLNIYFLQRQREAQLEFRREAAIGDDAGDYNWNEGKIENHSMYRAASFNGFFFNSDWLNKIHRVFQNGFK